MYRSRLGADLSRITLEYVSSINDDSEILLYDILGSQAHVIMLYEKKLLSRNDVRKILSALESIKDQKIDASSGSEDIHELVEMQVIKKAGMASGGKMHTARSRNDQVALDMRMKMRDDISILNRCLIDAIEALVSLAQDHKRTIMPLYTHMQQAQAGLFSHYLLAHADVLFRDLDRLRAAFVHVNENPLGAGPVGGTGIPIDRHITTLLLGFDRIVENSLDATSTRDFALEYVAAIAILMTNLSRIAEDFVIWSTAEFNFIELADEFASPSSVMPQKKNPDMLELTRGKTAEVIGGLAGILATSKGLASGYGRDLQQIKPAVWSASKTATSALLILKSILLTLHVNDKRMKKAAESGYLVALDIAEELVQDGVPFRTAHKISGRLVQTAHEQKKQLRKLGTSDISVAVKGSGASPESVARAIRTVTISSSLKNRRSLGSPGYDEQDRMISERIKKISECREYSARIDGRVSKALEGLAARVRELTKP